MANGYMEGRLQQAPPTALKARVEAALGRRCLSWSKPETGLSPAHRFVVELEDGLRVFVKAAMNPETAAWLRNERLARTAAPAFGPREVAWIDDGDDLPLLIVEALIDAYWPAQPGGVRWRPGDLDRVFAAIQALSDATPAVGLAAAVRAPSHGWRTIMQAPETYLAADLCSASWLDRHGAILARAETDLDPRGESIVHGDVRSDNICLTEDSVLFVDWSHARLGAKATDLAAFLPTAHLEGGPAPASVLPAAAGWAAKQSAEYAIRAAGDRQAPDWLRRVFGRLARINLDWAIASLGLVSLDR